MRDEYFIEGDSHLAEMQALGGVASLLLFSVQLRVLKPPELLAGRIPDGSVDNPGGGISHLFDLPPKRRVWFFDTFGATPLPFPGHCFMDQFPHCAQFCAHPLHRRSATECLKRRRNLLEIRDRVLQAAIP